MRQHAHHPMRCAKGCYLQKLITGCCPGMATTPITITLRLTTTVVFWQCSSISPHQWRRIGASRLGTQMVAHVNVVSIPDDDVTMRYVLVRNNFTSPPTCSANLAKCYGKERSGRAPHVSFLRTRCTDNADSSTGKLHISRYTAIAFARSHVSDMRVSLPNACRLWATK